MILEAASTRRLRAFRRISSSSGTGRSSPSPSTGAGTAAGYPHRGPARPGHRRQRRPASSRSRRAARSLYRNGGAIGDSRSCLCSTERARRSGNAGEPANLRPRHSRPTDSASRSRCLDPALQRPRYLDLRRRRPEAPSWITFGPGDGLRRRSCRRDGRSMAYALVSAERVGSIDRGHLRRSGADRRRRCRPLAASSRARCFTRRERQFPTDWSPDGRFIAFYGRDDDRATTCCRSTVGTEPREPPSTPADESATRSFSPDGRWSLTSRTETAVPSSSRRRISSRARGKRWQVSTGGGRLPRWRPRRARSSSTWMPSGALMAVRAPARDRGLRDAARRSRSSAVSLAGPTAASTTYVPT